MPAPERLSCVIKLIAWMEAGRGRQRGRRCGAVSGAQEHTSWPGVDDVFSAVLVKGVMLGDVSNT
ncbi:MAG: hypothetical protein ACLVJH_11310 [Faecalibacterium prausnitzii]